MSSKIVILEGSIRSINIIKKAAIKMKIISNFSKNKINH